MVHMTLHDPKFKRINDQAYSEKENEKGTYIAETWLYRVIEPE